MLDVLDVRVGRGVDVGCESPAAGELEVDLLLEEQNGLAGELREEVEQLRPAQERVEA